MDLKTTNIKVPKKEKPEYVFLTKTDLIAEKDAKEKIGELKKANKNALAVSIHDWESMEKVKKLLSACAPACRRQGSAAGGNKKEIGK